MYIFTSWGIYKSLIVNPLHIWSQTKTYLILWFMRKPQDVSIWMGANSKRYKKKLGKLTVGETNGRDLTGCVRMFREIVGLKIENRSSNCEFNKLNSAFRFLALQ